jgi:hypothetical protein
MSVTEVLLVIKGRAPVLIVLIVLIAQATRH